MFGDPSSFLWHAPASEGVYEWQDCRLVGDARFKRSLVRKCSLEDLMDYYPLGENVSLYRTLAAVEPTETGILEFVNRYGPLGEGVEKYAELPDGRHGMVEPLEDWRHTVVWLGEAIRLWDMIERGDRDGLARVIKWQGKKAVYYREPETVRRWLHIPSRKELPEDVWRRLKELERPIASVDHSPEILATFTPGDVVEPARAWVVFTVNGTLANTVQPAFLWDRRGRVLFRTWPRSLLGATYLQFATAIRSHRVSRECQVCGKPFEVTNIASRNDRLTCSQTCRTRAYRDRQKKARELHAAGRKPGEIAREIGSTTKKVREWIKKGE
jgi:hypothetical protein